MLKPDFIRELKQTKLTGNEEKVMERLREVWRSFDKAQRDEVLLLSGLKKASIERAYKTGNVSAKIITAVSQVAGVDPLYLAGINDEQRPFEEAIMVQFVTDLGYKVNKSDIAKQRKSKAEPAQVEEVSPVVETVPSIETGSKVSNPPENVTTSYSVLPQDSDIYQLLDNDAQSRLDSLTEEDTVLMLKSLGVQAGLSEEKCNRLALVKCLLLL